MIQKYGNGQITVEECTLRKKVSDKSLRFFSWLFNSDLRFDLYRDLEYHFKVKFIFLNRNTYF